MSSYHKTIKITPVGKPRMTRRDKWAKRPCVMRYWAFGDELRLKLNDMPFEPDSLELQIAVPMPKSWSKKKKNEHFAMPHKQKPDVDNMAKAVMDALLKDDSGVYHISVTKFWAYEGGIEITARKGGVA